MSAIIKPYGDQHAINNVLFVFEFAFPVPPHAFVDLRANGPYHRKFRESGLPRASEHQQLMLNISPGADGSAVPPQFLNQPGFISGATFDRIRPDGEPEFSINIQANALVIVCGEYVRWAGLWKKVIEYLSILAPWLNSIGAEFSALCLQYVDTFYVSFSDGKKAPLTELFNAESEYLPKNFSQLSHAFHSHHGFFSFPPEKESGRLLTNINVNVSESVESFDVNIVCNHKLELSENKKFVDEYMTTNKVAATVFQFLHDQNKEVIGDLLTESVKNRISFDSKSIA